MFQGCSFIILGSLRQIESLEIYSTDVDLRILKIILHFSLHTLLCWIEV